ncbi:MAG: PAS domain S-box protein [Caldiserica bacterium]|nr:PAS domain S-box protein [Caldisericota bacterium]MDH7561868.1 PAS domain S-box protein [Caldisericota bacterium]
MKTISGRLTIAVIIISLLALAGALVMVWGFVSLEIERERLANFKNSAQLIAHHLEDWWKTRINHLSSLSFDPPIIDFLLSSGKNDSESLKGFLGRASKEWGFYSVVILSHEGKNLLSSPLDFSELNLPELDFDNLHEATVPFKPSGSEQEYVLLIKRVENQGEKLGYLGVLIDWTSEVENLLEFPVPGTQSGECFLAILKEGRILPISDLKFLPGAEFSFFLPEPEGFTIPMRKALLGQSGTERAVDYRGVSVLASYHFIPGPNWGLVVKENWAEVMAPARRLAWIGFFVALTLIVLLSIFIYFLFSGILKPLKNLERQADQISAGADVEIKLERAPEEIKNLGKNISLMVQKIKQKDEEILRYERDWSRSLTETAKVFIIALDLEGKISFFNREAEEKLGYQRDEVLGKSAEFLFPPERREGVKGFISNIDLSKIPQSQIIEVIAKSGEVMVVDWAVTLIKDPEGKPQTIVGIGTDITEKERILKEREFQLKKLDLLNRINQEIIVSDLENLTPMARNIREVLDAHTVLILKTDSERKTITPIGWNWRPGYYEIPDDVLVQRLPATTEKGLVGCSIREGQPVVSGDAERDPRAHHIEGTSYADESVMVIPLKFQDSVLGAVFVGKMGLNQFSKEDEELLQTIAGSLAVAFYNKELLRALREEEERFRHLFTSIPDGVVLFDQSQTILEVNDSLLASLGYKREELLGKNISILNHPDSQAAAQQLFEEVVQKGSAKKEILNITKNGEAIPVEIFTTKIQYGGKTAFIGVSRDLRERKKFEQLKNDLLYAISHEMKTPIQSLMALVDIYSSLDPVHLAARAEELFEVMRRNIFRLKQLVDNFLEAQKLEQEAIKLAPSSFEIYQAIIETQEMMSPYAALRRVRLQNRFPPEELIIFADRERLIEVFTNLYSNALRFSPKEGTVTTSIQKKGDFLEVAISDQGPGIPENEMENLFERFFRPQSPNLKAMAGTGLGLYISRKIIESHGGKIWVETQEGEGTTIRFTLPITGPGENLQA